MIASLRSKLDVAPTKIALHSATIEAQSSTIAAQSSIITAHSTRLDEQAREITRRNARIELLEQQLAALKRRMFGQQSETVS